MLNLNIEKLKIHSEKSTLLDISFNISKATALIGESGSGKSLTLKALLNLVPQNLTVLKKITGNFELNNDSIGFIPQNLFTSLSPMTKISKQFFCKNKKKIEVLKLVGLDETVLNKFPTQLSGGQIQRVVIAIALSKDIKLLLLDEPTTALDIENTNNIIKLIKHLKDNLNILILFVTHDINTITDLCENILILKKGLIIEKGLTQEILNNPKESYTKTLINSSFKNKKFRK